VIRDTFPNGFDPHSVIFGAMFTIYVSDDAFGCAHGRSGAGFSSGRLGAQARMISSQTASRICRRSLPI